MDSCLCGAILNLTAYCSIWKFIEEFKIAHKQKSIIIIFFWQEDEAPLVNEALCLSTPKHNGK
jgi:hypothetical protein